MIRYDHDFDARQWQRYIECETGFILPNIQYNWLENAVIQTALSYGLTSVQLWQQLPFHDELRQRLLDKALIHESRFFRHLPSIDFVTECAEQHQRRKLTTDDTSEMFRIWSVGCASGEETWSLAMSLAAKQLSNYTILGTDVSQQVLAKARLGQYDDEQQSLIPPYCQQFVQPLQPAIIDDEASVGNAYLSRINVSRTNVSSSYAYWQITATLKSQVRFALHNIMDEKPPTAHLQQVIVCQNVLLYFRKFDQRDILARLSKQCALGGYIILAPGEALFWRPSNMRRIAHPQINAWQKIST
ncbi:MCP methyltransferase, CheR-type [Psychrobacter arcticus 273-4]|uniref:MCP methyltransferase, CheR-type n=2 Tax=Psychrobacter arcticus TaxID=334543 RepID=Q4FQP6_PSYA2|nr:MCP methyltransferase, CheR-type [Psychrobacter arcticus 273-4]